MVHVETVDTLTVFFSARDGAKGRDSSIKHYSIVSQS